MKTAEERHAGRSDMHLVRRLVIGILLAGFVTGFCSAAEVDVSGLLDFRDERAPFEAAGAPYHHKVKPWEPSEKKVFLAAFKYIHQLAPGVVERATAYRPIRVYRGRSMGKLVASAYLHGNSITVSDKLFDISDKELADVSAFWVYATVHELAHLADAFGHVSKGKTWIGLVKARMEGVHESFLQQTGVSVVSVYDWKIDEEPKKEYLQILDKSAVEQGFPTPYASKDPGEALAEIATYIALRNPNYNPPAKVKAFIESELLSMPYAPKEPVRHVHKGCIALEQNRLDDAMSAFSRAIELEPELVEARFQRAKLWMAEEDYDTAIAEYTRLIELEPASDRNYFMRGVAWGGKDEYDKAIADYGDAINRAPIEKSLDSYNNRGNMYIAKREYDKAIADFTLIVQHDRSKMGAWLGRGLAWRFKKEYDKAIADYGKVIELDSKYVPALLSRASCFMEKEDYERAIVDCGAVIELDPNNTEAHLRRAHSFMKKMDYDKAIADFSVVIRLEPDHVVALDGRSRAWYVKRRYDKAAADCDEIFRINPSFEGATALCSLVYHAFGSQLVALRDYDKAIQYLDKAIRLEPDKAEIFQDRGNAYSRKGEHDRAIRDYTQAIRLKPDYAGAFHGRGNAYGRKGEYDKAAADFTVVIQHDPTNARIWVARGHVRWSMKDHDKAIADFSRAIELAPKLVEAHFLRAELWLAMKEYDRAVAGYTKLIEFEPDSHWHYFKRGLARQGNEQYDAALADYGEAIRLKPDFAVAYGVRGDHHFLAKDYAKAVADYEKAVELAPKYVRCHNNRAWLLATCPDPKYRDGKKAVEAASLACELSEWKDPGCLNTLAAAHAEAGDFEKAVEFQTRAIETATGEFDKIEAKEQLELYKARKPYRLRE